MAQQQRDQRQWWQQGPLQPACALLQSVQHNLQRFAASPPWAPQPQEQQQQQQQQPAAGAKQHGPKQRAAAPDPQPRRGARAAAPPPQQVTKEELGRATWVFLHTLAAQFPERPTRQQQRDARNLVDALTRIYPCADCARHFAEIVRADPPTVSSGRDFQAWMCRAHNTVNRSIGKPTFNCDLAAARWAPLDCDAAGGSTCDLSVGAPAPRGRR